MPHRANRLTIVVAILLVGAALALSTATLTNTAAADVAVNDFAVPDESTEAEEINTVSISWAGGISWSDTPEPVESVNIIISAENPDGEMQELLSITCTHEMDHEECGFDASTDGSNYLELAILLIDHSDWTSEHFSPDSGEEVSHTIDVMAETEVSWDGGSITESATDSTTLTVTHPDDEEEAQADPDAFVELGTATVTLS